MPRVDLFEIKLSDDTHQTIKDLNGSGADVYSAYVQQCEEILLAATQLAYRSAMSKVPVRSQQLREHIQVSISDGVGRVYVEDGTLPHEPPHHTGLDLPVPHVDLGRSKPTSQKKRSTVRYSAKEHHIISRALKYSELAFLLDTGGRTLRKKTGTPQHQTNRNTKGLQQVYENGKLTKRRRSAFEDYVYSQRDVSETTQGSRKYSTGDAVAKTGTKLGDEIDTARHGNRILVDLAHKFLLKPTGVQVTKGELALVGGHNRRRRGNTKYQIDYREKQVENLIYKEYPKQERRRKRLVGLRYRLREAGASTERIAELDTEINEITGGHAFSLYNFVKEQFGSPFTQKGTRRRSLKNIGARTIKRASEVIDSETLKPRIESFNETFKTLNESKARNLVRKYQQDVSTAPFEKRKQALVRDYSKSLKEAETELTRLKSTAPTFNTAVLKGGNQISQSLVRQKYHERQARIASLTSHIATLKKGIATAHAAITSHQLPNTPKEWKRSKESIAMEPFHSVAKGSPTKGWIDAARTDFQNVLSSDSKFKDASQGKGGKRRIDLTSTVSTSSILGTRSIHAGGNPFITPKTKLAKGVSPEQAARDLAKKQQRSKANAEASARANDIAQAKSAAQAQKTQAIAKAQAQAKSKPPATSRSESKAEREARLAARAVELKAASRAYDVKTKRASAKRDNYAPRVDPTLPQGPFSPYNGK